MTLLILGFCASLYAGEERKVILGTIPKSGTHLAKKLIEGILHQSISAGSVRALQDPRRSGCLFHLLPETDHIMDRHEAGEAKVIMIRDPRDVLISQMHWIRKVSWWAPSNVIKKFRESSPEGQLTTLIEFPDTYFGVHYFVRKALEWMKRSDVFVCRFEDLVGPQGGGDRARQEATIRALAEHLGRSLSMQEVHQLADTLFGGTVTFREGQIGTWRAHFTEEHKRLFKGQMGQELIDLGYERDFNW